MNNNYQHDFILSPSIWIGRGEIQLSNVNKISQYSTRWDFSHKNSLGIIESSQKIQLKNFAELMHNQLLFFDLASDKFHVQFDHPSMGTVYGKGIITAILIAWEFRSIKLGFEALEFYEKQNDGSYRVYAEYTSLEQTRAIIKGKVWKDFLSVIG